MAAGWVLVESSRWGPVWYWGIDREEWPTWTHDQAEALVYRSKSHATGEARELAEMEDVQIAVVEVS